MAELLGHIDRSTARDGWVGLRARSREDPSAAAKGAFHRFHCANSGPLKQMGWSDGVDALIGGGISLPAGATQSHHKIANHRSTPWRPHMGAPYGAPMWGPHMGAHMGP